MPGSGAGADDGHVIPCADQTCEHGRHVPRAKSAVEAHVVQQGDEMQSDGGGISGQDLFAVREEEGFHLFEDLVVASQGVGIEQFGQRDEDICQGESAFHW